MKKYIIIGVFAIVFCLITTNAMAIKWYNVGNFVSLAKDGCAVITETVNFEVPHYIDIDYIHNYLPVCVNSNCNVRLCAEDFVDNERVDSWCTNTDVNGSLTNFSHINRYIKPGKQSAIYTEMWGFYKSPSIAIPKGEGFKLSIGKAVTS